jgi:hypothetical protein
MAQTGSGKKKRGLGRGLRQPPSRSDINDEKENIYTECSIQKINTNNHN